jgi:tRNA-dihydrouridine synthase B
VLGVPLQIGPVRLESNLMLAPIAGWSDLAWRITCRELGGVGLACTDLLSPHGLLAGGEKSLDLARTNDLDQPVGMQLYGSDPHLLSEAAKWCGDHGATVVDINMGCPVDKVTKKDGGSMLMCDIPRTVRTAEAIRNALPDHIPLTAKMRLGWDEQAYENRCAETLAVQLCRVGVCAITVHGRTTEMLFKGQCRREGIRRVVEAVGEATGTYTGEDPASGLGGVPVIGNGDITEPVHATEMINETGCAGVMIGRGAFAMPWIFRLAWAHQRRTRDRVNLSSPVAAPEGTAGGGPRSGSEGVPQNAPSVVLDLSDLEPTEDEKLDTFLAYFSRMREFRNDHYAMHRVKHKISRMAKHINGSHCKPLKEAVRTAKTPDAIIAAVESWRERMHGEGEPQSEPASRLLA